MTYLLHCHGLKATETTSHALNPLNSDPKLSSFKTRHSPSLQSQHFATVTESWLTQWGWLLFLKPDMNKQWDYRDAELVAMENGPVSPENSTVVPPERTHRTALPCDQQVPLCARPKELKQVIYITRSIVIQCRFLNLSSLNLKCD